jgi:hypothetical protein
LDSSYSGKNLVLGTLESLLCLGPAARLLLRLYVLESQESDNLSEGSDEDLLGKPEKDGLAEELPNNAIETEQEDVSITVSYIVDVLPLRACGAVSL